MKIHLVCFGLAICQVASFILSSNTYHCTSKRNIISAPRFAEADPWRGDVASNSRGTIQGCSAEQVGDSATDWIITIDGNEADLGRFSEGIYKKITADAKQQRFQGFRPGTIPPHLEPTYRAFAMDECARETVLEAMQQNNIRPFTNTRTDLLIENVSIPPPPKKGKKKKKGGRKKNITEPEESSVVLVEEVPTRLMFETMKEAIDAGWKPGQSFSFVANQVKGQKVLGQGDVEGAKPVMKPGIF